MINKDKYIQNLELFKKTYKKNKIEIKYEEINKYFFIENSFLTKKTIFLEEKFFEELLQIVGNSIQNFITNLDHYVNMRGGTQISDIEYNIVKNNKKILELLINFHILIKEHNLLYINHKQNTKDVIKIIEKSYKYSKEYYKINLDIETKQIKKLKEKLIEIKKENKKTPKFESSMYH